MPDPNPTAVVAALAAFVRRRLAETLGEVGARLGTRRSDSDLVAAVAASAAGVTDPTLAGARLLDLVVVGAAAPFAPTSYARARLLRQLHAGGQLTDDLAAGTDASPSSTGPGTGSGTRSMRSACRVLDEGPVPDRC